MAPTTMTSGWEHFSHGADVGICGWGPTMGAAFEQAALAVTAVICDPDVITPRVTVRLECHAPNSELLLFDWLNLVIEEMAARRLLFAQFQVEIVGGHLHARARGEPIDRSRHRPELEPKGATMTELRVTRGPDGLWTARCVIDV